MVSKRRGIHSKNSIEGDKNEEVLQQCYKCEKPILCEEIMVPRERNLRNEPRTNHQGRGNNVIYPGLSEGTHLICNDCGNNATKQETREVVNQLRPITFNPLMVILVTLILCILGGLAFVKYKYPEKSFAVKVQNQTQDEIDFDNELYSLEDVYTQQEERVWYTFAAGIKSVTAEKPNKPSVFLLLYDDDGAEKTVKCLVKDVTRAASKYLMKREIKPLMYAGRELNQEQIINDPGKLLVIHKDNVERTGAMIITNLENVDPKVATSFHFFCDRYSPLVEKAIYFFTLKLEQVPKSSKVLQKFAEDSLQNLWGKYMPDNILLPLITRLTGNVLKISNDHSNCYL